jgi:hypothetical protein
MVASVKQANTLLLCGYKVTKNPGRSKKRHIETKNKNNRAEERQAPLASVF